MIKLEHISSKGKNVWQWHSYNSTIFLKEAVKGDKLLYSTSLFSLVRTIGLDFLQSGLYNK